MKKISIALLALVLISGCASSSHSNKEEIAFVNEPQTTKVQSESEKVVTTTKKVEVTTTSDTTNDSEERQQSSLVTNKEYALVNIEETQSIASSNKGNAPKISGSDLYLTTDQKTYSLVEGLVVEDVEDGKISLDETNVVETTLDISKTGDYYAMISVKDQDGNETLFSRPIHVYKDAGTILDSDGNLELEYNGSSSTYDVYMYVKGYSSNNGYVKLNENSISGKRSYSVTLANSSTKRAASCLGEPFYLQNACSVGSTTYVYLNNNSYVLFSLVGSEGDKENIRYDASLAVDNIPLTLEANEDIETFTLKLPAEGIADHKVYADVYTTFEGSDGTFKRVSLNVNNEDSNGRGKVSVDYDRSQGLVMMGDFKESGTYTISVKIYDRNTVYFADEYSIIVMEPFTLYEFSGDMVLTYTNWSGDSLASGITTTFRLSHDLNVSKRGDDMEVTLAYADNEKFENERTVSVKLKDLMELPKEIKANDSLSYTISSSNSELSGLRNFISNHEVTYVKTTITLIDNDGDKVRTTSAHILELTH